MICILLLLLLYRIISTVKQYRNIIKIIFFNQNDLMNNNNIKYNQGTGFCRITCSRYNTNSFIDSKGHCNMNVIWMQ